MDNDNLLQILQALEVELHRTKTRRDLARLDALLHPDFEEAAIPVPIFLPRSRLGANLHQYLPGILR